MTFEIGKKYRGPDSYRVYTCIGITLDEKPIMQSSAFHKSKVIEDSEDWKEVTEPRNMQAEIFLFENFDGTLGLSMTKNIDEKAKVIGAVKVQVNEGEWP